MEVGKAWNSPQNQSKRLEVDIRLTRELTVNKMVRTINRTRSSGSQEKKGRGTDDRKEVGEDGAVQSPVLKIRRPDKKLKLENRATNGLPI